MWVLLLLQTLWGIGMPGKIKNPCTWQGTAASSNCFVGPCEEGQSDITFRTFSFRTLGKTWDENNLMLLLVSVLLPTLMCLGFSLS